jgi:site-specific DNA-methyltransferase (adenine-specific)/adenine-specific DNA-methyltransferase
MADDASKTKNTIPTSSGRGSLKLTEPEHQEVIRFLEAGKPLPDKYRFLL